MLELIKVTDEQLPRVCDLYNRANDYKSSKNDRAWGADPFTPDEVRNWQTTGDVYVATQNGQTVGAVALFPTDERIWGKRNDSAVYLSKLAIDPDHKGQGVGAKIVALVEDIARDTSAEFVRFDCDKANIGL